MKSNFVDTSFSTTWIRELCDCWEAQLQTAVSGSNASFFELKKEAESLIMRISSTRQRTAEAIKAELEWMRDLQDRGLSINTPIADRSLSWIQVREWKGEPFVACVNRKLEGAIPGPKSLWTPALLQAWGQTMAHFHRAAQDFKPRHRRSMLNISLLMKMAEEILNPNDPALKVLAKSGQAITKVPLSSERYGLIHSDLTQANLRWKNGQLSVLDFDDCQYAPFIYDLGICLSVSLSNLEQTAEHFETAVNFFLQNFLEGYFSVRDFLMEDLCRLQAILDYFNAIAYLSFIHKGWEVSHPQQLANFRERLAMGSFKSLQLEERILDILSSIKPIH